MFIAARMFTTHNARNRFNAIVIANHNDRRIGLIGLAIKSENLIAVFRMTYNEIAFDFFGIKHMQRTTTIKCDVIRDINKRVDGTQTNRFQTTLHPFRARAIFYAAHKTQREGGRQMFLIACKIQFHIDGAGALAFDRR